MIFVSILKQNPTFLIVSPILFARMTVDWTYPWSYVTHIFRSGQPRHGGNRKPFEVMTSIWPIGTFGSIASFLSAILYH